MTSCPVRKPLGESSTPIEAATVAPCGSGVENLPTPSRVSNLDTCLLAEHLAERWDALRETLGRWMRKRWDRALWSAHLAGYRTRHAAHEAAVGTGAGTVYVHASEEGAAETHQPNGQSGREAGGDRGGLNSPLISCSPPWHARIISESIRLRGYLIQRFADFQ